MILIEIDFAGASIFVSVILPYVSSDRYIGRSLIFVLVLLILLLLARLLELSRLLVGVVLSGFRLALTLLLFLLHLTLVGHLGVAGHWFRVGVLEPFKLGEDIRTSGGRGCEPLCRLHSTVGTKYKMRVNERGGRPSTKLIEDGGSTSTP